VKQLTQTQNLSNTNTQWFRNNHKTYAVLYINDDIYVKHKQYTINTIFIYTDIALLWPSFWISQYVQKNTPKNRTQCT